MIRLSNVSEESIEEFDRKIKAIIQDATGKSMAYQNEIVQHGEDAHRMIKMGFEFTAKMLRAAISTGEPAILDDQAKWAVSRLPHDKVSISNLIRRLNRMKRTIRQILSKNASKEIVPFVDYLIERIEEIKAQNR